MTDDRNPYALPERAELSNIAHQEPPSGTAPDSNETSGPVPIRRMLLIFTSSYIPSLVSAISTVSIWLYIMIMMPSPPRRTNGPDTVEVAFLFITALPSVVTCLSFSWCYCLFQRTKDRTAIWPAIVFGIMSGLLFNAFTAFSLLSYLVK